MQKLKRDAAAKISKTDQICYRKSKFASHTLMFTLMFLLLIPSLLNVQADLLSHKKKETIN